MQYWRIFLRGLRSLPGVLLAGLILCGLFTPTAEAAVKGCRTDPIVILSDGTILDIQAAIDTSVSNVREIHYIVHGPPGVKLVAAISTPTLGFRGKETFTYYADAQPYQYVTDVVVHTTGERVSVTSYTTFLKVTLLRGPLLSLQYKPVHGYSGETLRTVLTR
ncbi:MAG: hypothetical protein DIU80_020725 [Chloroflexota bacterium]